MAHEDERNDNDPVALGDELLAALAFINDLAGTSDLSDALAGTSDLSDVNDTSSCRSDALLHELQPLDDDETARSHTTGTSTPNAVCEHSQPLPKKRVRTWDPNRARNARRGELIYLRAQVADLEKQLAAVRATAPQSDAQPRSPRATQSASVCSDHDSASLSRMWEDVAASQWRKRSSAERENIRLRFALASQVKVAKSLQRALQRTVSARDDLARSVNGRHYALECMHSRPPQRLSDAGIMDALMAGVEQSYAEIDDVYRSRGLDQRETSHFDVHLEMVKALPFAFDAAVQAIWDHFADAKDRLPSRVYYKSQQVVDSATRMIVETFHADVQAKDTTARFRVHQVIRCYDEVHRAVFVWRAHVDPLALGDEPVRGVGFLEQGYIVIKKVSEASTLVQPCFIITPSFDALQPADGELHANDSDSNNSNSSHHTIGAMTDFMLAATVANIHASHEMIEDVLMQAALGRKRCHT